MIQALAVTALAPLSTASIVAPAFAEASAPRVTAQVTVAGSEDDLDALVDALREPLETLGLHLHGGRASPDAIGSADGADSGGAAEGARGVRIWLDLRREDRVDIVVRAGGSPPVHRTILRDASRSRAVLAEDVAYSVRATLESLLATLPPPPLPVVAAPTPPRPPAPDPLFGVDAAAVANARGIAASTAAFGGGVAIDLAFWGRRRFRPQLWVVGSFDAPFATSTPAVSLETSIYSARVVPGLELVRVGPLRVAGGVGYGVDLFRVNPSQADIVLNNIRPPSTYADPILEGQVLARIRLLQSVGLVLAVTLDYDTGPHNYLEASAGTLTDVLAPWRMRPAGYLGVCFRLTGASGCAGAE